MSSKDMRAGYQLLPAGTRVRRGPTWKWGYQDRRGLGIVKADPGYSLPVWIYVLWDNGISNSYRVGYGLDGFGECKDWKDVVPALTEGRMV